MANKQYPIPFSFSPGSGSGSGPLASGIVTGQTSSPTATLYTNAGAAPLQVQLNLYVTVTVAGGADDTLEFSVLWNDGNPQGPAIIEFIGPPSVPSSATGVVSCYLLAPGQALRISIANSNPAVVYTYSYKVS